jgi:hypothetical protein
VDNSWTKEIFKILTLPENQFLRPLATGRPWPETDFLCVEVAYALGFLRRFLPICALRFGCQTLFALVLHLNVIGFRYHLRLVVLWVNYMSSNYRFAHSIPSFSRSQILDLY